MAHWRAVSPQLRNAYPDHQGRYLQRDENDFYWWYMINFFFLPSCMVNDLVKSFTHTLDKLEISSQHSCQKWCLLFLKHILIELLLCRHNTTEARFYISQNTWSYRTSWHPSPKVSHGTKAGGSNPCATSWYEWGERFCAWARFVIQ